MANKQKHGSDKQHGSLERRTFLAGAGGMTIMAMQPRPARASQTAAKKYRVGVIGHTGRGNYGHGLDKVWHDIPQAEIVGVADADPQGLVKAVQRLGQPKGYTDYRQMLDELKPDLLSIGALADQRRDMVVAAAERGTRGIYMEKPLCTSLEEADQMVAVCDKHGVKLALAHQMRYDPRISVIKQIIDSGKLGRVLEMRARGKEDRRGGSLDLWILGTHVLNLMAVLGGDPEWCFATVLQGKRPVTKEDVLDLPAYGLGPVAGDEVHAMYWLASGVTAYFDSVREAGAKPPWRFGLRVYGSEGVLHIHPGLQPFLVPTHYLPDPLWCPGRSEKEWIPVSTAGIGKPEPLEGGHLHPGNVRAVQDLIAAIEEDRPPLDSLYDARTNLEMIVGVFESHRVGGPVTFPLENRKNPLAMLD